MCARPALRGDVMCAGRVGGRVAVLGAVLGLLAGVGAVGAVGVGQGVDGVLWYAPFFSGGGYCSEAIAFADALAAEEMQTHDTARWALQIVQHGDTPSMDFISGLPSAQRERMVRRERAAARTLGVRSMFPQPRSAAALTESAEAPRLRRPVAVCHSEPGAWHPARYPTSVCPPHLAAYTVGRTMFETDRLPDGWEHRLNAMDEVWVPTEFHRRIFQENGVEKDKIVVVGEPVDTDFFNPARVSRAQAERRFPFSSPPTPSGTTTAARPFVFLSVFKWEKRKGWDILLSQYFAEFSREDNVVLVLLTNAYHSTGDFWRKIRDFTEHTLGLGSDMSQLPRVEVLTGLPQEDMPRLYRAVDAVVLPTRGEGWGRPHCEALSMAVPLIATNWSGPTEYLNEENGFPLRVDGLEPVADGPFASHAWASPSKTHLRALMRQVIEQPEAARARAQRGRTTMVERYSPAAMGALVAKHLHRIDAQVRANGEERNRSSRKSELDIGTKGNDDDGDYDEL